MRKLLIIISLLILTLQVNAQAQAWITAPNQNRLLEQQTEKEWSSASPSAQCITINANGEYQTIDGFGWMLTEGSAKLLKTCLHSRVRQDLLRELYSVEDGLGASIVRISIGASDLSEYEYSYSPSKDESMSNFSMAGPDLDYLIPVLQEIKAINPNIKILATPWSAPTWMKTGAWGHSGYSGGTLQSKYYAAYAAYFVKYLQTMRGCGLPVWAITPQNEPLNGNGDPSMKLSKEEEYAFIDNYLGPAMAQNGFGDVKIIGYDHNCDNTAYPIYVAGSDYVWGTAFHLYAGNISAMQTVYNATNKPVYFTEQYTGANGDFAGDYNWHMQNVMLGSVLNMSSSAIEWNLAADPNNGPHTSGGCSECKGALTISTNSITSRNVSYYIVGTMSKVVRSGAVRVAASGAPNFKYAAFRNPDGSLAVVAFNNGSTQNLSIRMNGQILTYLVPQNGALSLLVPDVFNPVQTNMETLTAPAQWDAALPAYNLLGQRVGDDYQGFIIQNNKLIYKN